MSGQFRLGVGGIGWLRDIGQPERPLLLFTVAPGPSSVIVTWADGLRIEHVPGPVILQATDVIAINGFGLLEPTHRGWPLFRVHDTPFIIAGHGLIGDRIDDVHRVVAVARFDDAPDERLLAFIFDDTASTTGRTRQGSLGLDGMFGGASADRFAGRLGDDFLLGRGGDDWLDGGAGDDVLSGGDGADILFGGEGADTLFGGSANVTATLAPANLLDGGAGDDVLVLHAATAASRALGGAGDDRISIDFDVSRHVFLSMPNPHAGTTGGDHILDGGDGADTIFGGAGDERLLGRAGDDRLYAGNGADVLIGGSGADTMMGGIGTDRLVSGADGVRDVFLYQGAGEGSDRIIGFEAAFDRIAFLPQPGTPGFHFASSDGPMAATGPGQSLHYNTRTGHLWMDWDGPSGAPPELLAILVGAPALTPENVIVG